MLAFLIPLASVVYIILFVIAFLRINRERFEQEIAREHSLRIAQRPNASDQDEGNWEKSAALNKTGTG